MICLSEDSFQFNDLTVGYNEIRGIGIWRSTTEVTRNFAHVGDMSGVELVLFLPEWEGMVEIRERYTMFGNIRNYPDLIDELVACYEPIRKRSIEARLDIAFSEISSKGWYEYGECRFTPGEGVSVGRQDFELNHLQLFYQFPVLQIDGYATKPRLLRSVSKPKWSVINIDCRWNPDVLLRMLQTHFSDQLVL